MPSLIQGYEYDIFISYRHNDNRSGWVTEFVNVLRIELAATVKESVSIYLDSNPYDGLLETHDVDGSLKEKIKCLVFIPIASQTYCDPKSFAWQKEFLAFLDFVKADEYGPDIKLHNGNVARRILPVRIHELDEADKRLFEASIGGVMRPVDFIYSEPGVNRPLKVSDKKEDNKNHTDYINQVNKVAHAVKEIIQSMQSKENGEEGSKEPYVTIKRESHKTTVRKLWPIIIGFIALAGILYFLLFNRSGKPELQLDKSIAVLPFDNISNDPDQNYFSDGMMEEILNHLVKIKGLKVISRTTMMQYKGTNKSMSEIASELNVATLLEGSVRKSGNQLRITVQLIDGSTDLHLWSETYDRKMEDVFTIQSDIAQLVASSLKAEITPELRSRMEHVPTENLEAYNLWLLGNSIYDGPDIGDFGKRAVDLWEQAIKADSSFAQAYAAIGEYWLNSGGFMGHLDNKEGVAKAFEYLNKALALDPDYPLTHNYLANAHLWYRWDFESAGKELATYQALSPSSLDGSLADFYSALGKFEEAIEISQQIVASNNNNPDGWGSTGFPYYFDRQFKKGDAHYDKALELFPEHWYILTEAGRGYVYSGQYQKSIAALTKVLAIMQNPRNRSPRALAFLAISYYHTSKKQEAKALLEEIVERSKNSSTGSPAFHIAMIYSQMDERELAYQWLEKAYQDHEVEMYWLKVEPPFEPIHDDPRWQSMLDKVGFPT